MAKPAIDLEEDSKVLKDTSEVGHFIKQVRDIEAQMEELATQTKNLAERKERLLAETLPEAMATAGIQLFKTEDGWKAEIKPFVDISVPTLTKIEKAAPEEKRILIERRKMVFEFLKKHNGSALIVTKLEAEVPKGGAALAEKGLKALQSLGIAASNEEGVNMNSLKSWVKEILEKGEVMDGKQIKFPREAFGLVTGRRAKLTPPKAAK